MKIGNVGELVDLSGRLGRRIGAEHAHLQLVRDFERLMTGTGDVVGASKAGDGPRVGVAAFDSGSWHFVLEALLAHALAQRGARPELLVCDMPDLPICDQRTIHSRNRERCAGCIDDKRELVEACRLPWRGISSLVAPESLARACAKVAALDADELAQFQERGWPIGRWLHVSASHFLRCDARGDGSERIAARRRLLATAIVFVEATERWLDELRPDIVIVESGAHFTWRIALELARARGIRVVCREMGKGGWDSHIYALDADCMAPNLNQPWVELENNPLSPAEESAVDRFLDELPAKTYVQRTPADPQRTNLLAHLGVPSGKRIAVAFTNVTWDLATAGRDVAFTGVWDWIRQTVRALAPFPDAHLIVRAHPAEASVMTRERILDQVALEWPAGLSQVTLIQPEQAIAARDLLAQADLVLAYNSTAGLEAAMHGRTTVVTGNPHYRGKGFTIDIATRAEYIAALDYWASGRPISPPASARELARRYFHLFFLRYHIPMGWTTSPLEPPYELMIRSMEDLGPGRNPALDVVCDGILNGRQIVLPRLSG